MIVEKTKLTGALLIKLETFEDHRGQYVEIYNKNLYAEHGIDIEFVQDDISTSTQHVLRGIHGDNETWKLISCLHGKFYLVVVNCDPASDRFGRWQSFVLSDTNRHQVLVPPMFGNAHLVLSEKAIFHYKQNTYYNPKGQFTYVWNDPRLNIWWPIKNPILSQRDELGRFVDQP
jgi:dTDP-4-dehydrorhamnose 3,5-epimerase